MYRRMATDEQKHLVQMNELGGGVGWGGVVTRYLNYLVLECSIYY